LHWLRHIIGKLGNGLSPAQRQDPAIKEMPSYGCPTRMHVVRLQAPRLPNEDVTKDIDFAAEGIHLRRQAGYEDTPRAIKKAAWREDMAPLEGIRIADRDRCRTG
jgi:NTE family protein